MSAKPFYPGKYIIYCTATGGPDNTEETESCYILSPRGERSSSVLSTSASHNSVLYSTQLWVSGKSAHHELAMIKD